MNMFFFLCACQDFPKNLDAIYYEPSPEGVKLAEVLCDELSSYAFDLIITSGIPATDRMAAVIAQRQPALDDLVSRRSLYLPANQHKARLLLDRYGKYEFIADAFEDPVLNARATSLAETIRQEAGVAQKKKAVERTVLVVTNDILIAHIVATMAPGFENDFFDHELALGSGIILRTGDNEPLYDFYAAPKID